MNSTAMTVLLVVTLSTFAWSAYRRTMLARATASEPEFKLASIADLMARLELLAVYWLGQKKMPKNEKYRLAGVAHIGIFAAFLVLGLNSVLLWFRGYDPSFDFWGLLARRSLIREFSLR